MSAYGWKRTLVDQLLGNPEVMPIHQVITYQYLFPYKVVDGAGADTARLIAMFNTGIALPALQLNEIDIEHHHDKQEKHRHSAHINNDQNHREVFSAHEHEETRSCDNGAD